MTANLKCFFYIYLSKIGGKLVFLGNLAPKDARKLDIKDDFIKELIELWADLIIGIPLPLNLITVLDIFGITQ